MIELETIAFDPDKDVGSVVADDTIVVIIKCGGRTFAKGYNLPDTQEKTALAVEQILENTINTVDIKGIKKGGPRAPKIMGEK